MAGFTVSFGNGGAANMATLSAPTISAALALNGPTLTQTTSTSGTSLPAGESVVSSVALPGAGGGGVVDTLYNTALNSYTFDVKSDWNSVKNVLLTSDTNESIVLKDFVHTEVTLGGTEASSVTIANAKRGSVTTGAGDDKVSVSLLSNDANWVNAFTIKTGDGNDNIVVTAGSSATAGGVDGGNWIAATTATNGGLGVQNGSVSSVVIDAGSGNDTIDLSAVKLASSFITGGTGRDEMTASQGKDTFIFAQGDSSTKMSKADAVLSFGAGDKLDLYGSESDWSVEFSDGENVLVHNTTNEVIFVEGIDLTSTSGWFL